MSDLFTTGIIPVVNQHLLDEAAKVRNYGNYWSASSAGYCQRKLIFDRLKIPHTSELDPRKQRVFSAGHIFHNWLQELTREAGISIAQEVELQDEDLMIRGHFDDLVLIDRNLILYDFKTTNSRSFMWAKKNGNAMSHFHKMQLGTYMYMLRSATPITLFQGHDTKDLIEARILKIEKDTLMMMEQQLMWSPDLEKEVVGFWSTLNGYWDSKTIPRCTCPDYENGFMAKEAYNDYFYKDEPCSSAWALKHPELIEGWKW